MHVCGNFWVHVYEAVGCKVCGCWVHPYEKNWAHVCGCWVHVCGNGWVQSMRLLGAKYADVGCKIYGDVWVQSICLLGASLIRLVACLTVGSLPDSRWLNSPLVSCSLGPGAPGAPGPNNQNNQSINESIKQSLVPWWCVLLRSTLPYGNTISYCTFNTIGNSIGN